MLALPSRFLAGEAHKRGLAIGLKNCADILPDVEPLVDWWVGRVLPLRGGGAGRCVRVRRWAGGRGPWQGKHAPGERPASGCTCRAQALRTALSKSGHTPHMRAPPACLPARLLPAASPGAPPYVLNT